MKKGLWEHDGRNGWIMPGEGTYSWAGLEVVTEEKGHVAVSAAMNDRSSVGSEGG